MNIQSNTQKVIKGISSQTIVTIALGVVEILSFSIMSRLLTKEDFGYYAAITAITAVFSSFSETGIGSAIIQKKEINKSFVNSAFTLNLFFGLILTLSLFVLAGPLSRIIVDDSMSKPLRIMSITLFCHCLTSINFSLMRRKLQFLRVGIINLISLVIATALAIVLAVKGYGYYAILAKSVVAAVIALIISHFGAKTRYSISFDFSVFKSIFSFSGWLMAGAVFRNLSGQVDRLMMGRLLSVSSLGIYNRPKEFITQIGTKLNSIFDTALFPVLSGIQDDLNSLQRSFKTSLYYLNIFASILTVGFIINHELLIRIFMGEQWLNVKLIFVILSVSLLFNIDGRLADCYLRSLGLTKVQFFFRVAETFFKIIGVVIGSRWDVLGVVICVVIIDVIIKLLKTCYVSNVLQIKLLSSFGVIVSGWRSSILVLILCICLLFCFSHSFWADIALLVCFALSVFVIFVFFPSLVGHRYQEEAFPKLLDMIKNKLSFLKR